MANDEFAGAVEAGSGSGDTWKPENEGDTLVGTLKAIKTNVGQNDSNVYVFEEVADAEEDVSVWGSAVLDSKFEEIPVGSRVKIEFLGRVKGKGPQPYKDFKVLYKAPIGENPFNKE